MNSEVDQFGRSTNNSDALNDDKSKRILEALSDIKNQLQNDEFIPKVEKENISRKGFIVSRKRMKLNLCLLKRRPLQVQNLQRS